MNAVKVIVPFGDLQKAIYALKGMDRKLDDGLNKIRSITLKDLKARTPRSKERQNAIHLADAWVADPLTKRGTIRSFTIKNIAPHSEVINYLESGTKAHIIPGNPFLAFKIGNKVIIVRHVHHPGTKALKLMTITDKNIEANITRLLTEIASEMSGDFEK